MQYLQEVLLRLNHPFSVHFFPLHLLSWWTGFSEVIWAFGETPIWVPGSPFVTSVGEQNVDSPSGERQDSFLSFNVIYDVWGQHNLYKTPDLNRLHLKHWSRCCQNTHTPNARFVFYPFWQGCPQPTKAIHLIFLYTQRISVLRIKAGCAWKQQVSHGAIWVCSSSS